MKVKCEIYPKHRIYFIMSDLNLKIANQNKAADIFFVAAPVTVNKENNIRNK